MLPGVYDASLTLENTVAIHGEGASLQAPGTGLRVQDAANATVYDLAIRKQGGADPITRLAIYVISSTGIVTPRLRLERVTIETQGEARAMHVNQGTVTAVRTTLRAPTVAADQYMVFSLGTVSFERSRLEGGGGISVVGGHFTATNSVLFNLGGHATEGSLAAAAGGSISVSYSTIYGSSLPCGVGDVPSCASAARTGVCIENSILSRADSASSINGDRCRCDYCMITPQQTAVIGANNTLNGFISMNDPMNGDFHLQTGSDAIDAAHPTIVGTPDFDGTPRPQGPRSDVGAFEFKK